MSQRTYDEVIKAKGGKRPLVVAPGHRALDELTDAAIMAWQDDIEKETKIKVSMSYVFNKQHKQVGIRVLAQQMDGDRNRIEMTGTQGISLIRAMIGALDAEAGVRHGMTTEEATALRLWILRKQEENAAAAGTSA